MTMYRSARILLITVALGVIVRPTQAQTATTSAPTSSQDSSKRVRVLVRQAGESIRTGRFEEARQSLLEAWGLRRDPDIAGLLAQAEIQLKRYADASEHLDFALANFSATQSEKLLGTLQQAFEDAKSHVGQVKVVTNRDGADISVDGRSIGKSPLQSVVYVEPGRHEIRVKQVENTEGQAFEVAAGKAIEVSVPFQQSNAPTVTTNLPPVSSHPPPPNAPISQPVRETPQRSIVPLIVGGSVFAAGLGAAIGFRIAANSKDSDAKALLQRLGAGGCQAPTSRKADCAKLLDTAQSKDRYANWSTAGFVVAGAALVATASYWFWPRADDGKMSGGPVHLNVTASASRSEVWMTGEF